MIAKSVWDEMHLRDAAWAEVKAGKMLSRDLPLRPSHPPYLVQLPSATAAVLEAVAVARQSEVVISGETQARL